MDIFEANKDTELPLHHRPQRIQALSHIFIGIGIALVLMMILGLIGSVIAALNMGYSLADLTSQKGLKEITSNTTALRIMNLFGSALPLILAALITTAIAFKGKVKSIFGLQKLNASLLVLSLLFFASCTPLIGLLLEWNASFNFSGISEPFHNWVVAKELENNALYEVIAGAKTNTDLWLNLVLMALLPALAEELFFRGFLLNSLHGLTKNIHLSIVISASIFALIHMQFFKLMPMIFLGIAFGYMVYWNGSVWAAVLAHFANNAMAVFSLHFLTDGSYEEVLSQEQNLSMVLVSISAIVMIVLFVYLQRKAEPKLQNLYE